MREYVDCKNNFSRSLVGIVWDPRVLVSRDLSQASTQYNGEYQRVRGVHDLQRILVARNYSMLWNRVYDSESVVAQADSMGSVDRDRTFSGGIGCNVLDVGC
jgi:hypothetical protein